jgi:hypothetical protein
MQNTPTGCGSDLHTILGFFNKTKTTSRSVNIVVQRLDLNPDCINVFCYQPKLRPVYGFQNLLRPVMSLIPLSAKLKLNR